MEKRRTVLCAFFALSFLIGVTIASADPILLTSGSASIWWDESTASFLLTGDNFSASGGGIAGAGASFGEGTAGQVVNLNGSINPNILYTGTLTLNGITYSLPGAASRDQQGQLTGLTWSGGLQFQTTPVVLPMTSAPTFLLETPFLLTGTLMGLNPDQTVAFAVDVAGQGMASATLTNHVQADGSNFFTDRIGGVGYVVSAASAPSATPEPSTLMLTGIALAALGRRFSRLT